METTPLFRICPSCGKLLPQQPGDLQIPACAECLGDGNNPALIEAWRTHLRELQKAEKKNKSRKIKTPHAALTILAALGFVVGTSYLARTYIQKRQADILISLSEPDVVSVTEIESRGHPADAPKSAE